MGTLRAHRLLAINALPFSVQHEELDPCLKKLLPARRQAHRFVQGLINIEVFYPGHYFDLRRDYIIVWNKRSKLN